MQRKLKLALVTLVIILAAELAILTYQQGYYTGLAQVKPELEIHVNVLVEHADGTVEGPFHHAGTLTNTGKEYIEGKLGNNAFANNTAFAEYITLSTDTSSPSATWINIPSEITTGGLARAQGTYTSTGTGQWKIEKQFTASATHTNVQLTGLNWASGASSGSLMCADTFTAVTLNSGDKITVTWMVSVS